MIAQHLLDYIIKPSLKFMGGNYDSKDAQMLMLATAATESKCGYWIQQKSGSAKGVWQMEWSTLNDIYNHCDALQNDSPLLQKIDNVDCFEINGCLHESLQYCNAYACMMARLKYAMDPKPLPKHSDKRGIYEYYKRVYNTYEGAATWEHFCKMWSACKLDTVLL